MTNPVTACIIVNDDPHLSKTLACLAPHVAEIVVVYTCLNYSGCGVEVPDSIGSALDKRIKVDHFPHCTSADGELFDFSAARQRSFDLATQPWILWVDSDDLIEGLDHLPEVLAEAELAKVGGNHVRVKAPYEYAYNEHGHCIKRVVRERILSNDGPGTWQWLRPYHEGVVAVDRPRQVDIRTDKIVWKHQSEPGRRTQDRALRILTRYVAKQLAEGVRDPRTFYDLAREHQLADNDDDAIRWFTQYFEISDRPEERAQAALHMSDLHWKKTWSLKGGMAHNPLEALVRAKNAVANGKRFDDYYQVAKIEWVTAGLRKEPERLAEAIAWAHKAIAVTRSGDFDTNPYEREFAVYELLADCHAQRGEWVEAISAVRKVLAKYPSDKRWLLKDREYSISAKLAADEEATGPREADESLDIVIACLETPKKWDPEIAAKQGIGGSETAVIEMASRLANMGHRVRVYCTCDEGLHGNVEYRGMDGLAYVGACDVLVSWRTAAYLDPEWFKFASKVKVIWAHDVLIHAMDHRRSLLADKVLALSKWHKDELCKTYRLHPNNVVQTRNGISAERFQQPRYNPKSPSALEPPLALNINWMSSVEDPDGRIVRNPHKVIYSSSPDRGLPALLGMWPRIRAQVPDAELHVFYGFDSWEEGIAHLKTQQTQNHRGYIHAMREWMKALEPMGVFARGRVDQRTLAQEMLSAGVWAYPAWAPSPETSCIGIVEALAAGLAVVTSNVGALPETLDQSGTIVDGDWLDPDYQDDFVNAVVDELKAPLDEVDRRYIAEAIRTQCSWDGVAEQWDGLFRELLEDAEAHILPAYQGVA